ncbi:MAG TPA: DUF2062 domain-containing protein [Candidatus Cybelea sp.]|nr:DUF2062 domain-containing protein [Candidatus Cybelea sp.]
MFRRRKPRGWRQRLREAIWPKAGWRRTARYYGHRLLRLNDTPYSIAAGLANGVAISFTPFLGFHVILACLLSWAVRGNILAAVLGTSFANPWTLPLISLWTYRLGRLIYAIEGERPLPAEFTLDFLRRHFWDIFAPMAVGGMLSASVVWLGVFFVARGAIHGRRQRRHSRRLASLSRNAKE